MNTCIHRVKSVEIVHDQNSSETTTLKITHMQAGTLDDGEYGYVEALAEIVLFAHDGQVEVK